MRTQPDPTAAKTALGEARQAWRNAAPPYDATVEEAAAYATAAATLAIAEQLAEIAAALNSLDARDATRP